MDLHQRATVVELLLTRLFKSRYLLSARTRIVRLYDAKKVVRQLEGT